MHLTQSSHLIGPFGCHEKDVIPLDLGATIEHMVPKPPLVDRIVLVQGQLRYPDPVVNFMKLEGTEVWTCCNDALQNSLLHDNVVDIKNLKPVSMWVGLR